MHGRQCILCPRCRCNPRQTREKPLTKAKIQASHRIFLTFVAVLLGIVALVLPTHWYDVLPRDPDAYPRPFSGAELLRLTFVLDALIAGFLAATGWRPQPDNNESADWRWHAAGRDLSRREAVVLVTLITLVGAILRFYKIGADLWIDEIATAAQYAARPLLAIFGGYENPGNHLLNSLLVRISTSIFGESEMSVRLPAVLFGIATVPVVYLAARLAMSRAASVGAAALIAVSYHHIFFSQNSRGYAGYLLFVLAGSALLASLLRKSDGLRWIAYVVAMSLAIASLMSAAFAVVAHVIVAAAAIVARKRKGLAVRPLVERLVVAFAAIGLIAFHIYGITIPDVLTIYPKLYSREGTGFFFFSRAFMAEMIRGISAGFAFGIAAVPVLIAAAAGFVVLARRNWIIAFSLAGTVAATIGFLVLRGQSVSPRLLVAGIPLAILSATATIDALVRAPRAALAAGAVLAAVSLIALPSYYSAPKQPFRAAIEYVEKVREPDQKVIVAYPGSRGIRYYLERDSLGDPSHYQFMYNRAAYEAVKNDPATERALVVTTLFRALRSDGPDIAAEIERYWEPVQRFRGTLGDGSITIWRRRRI